MPYPALVFADSKGEILAHPWLKMVVSSGWNRFFLPQAEELSLNPSGSTLFYLPGRRPIGYNLKTKQLETVSLYQGKPVFALSAFLVPAYLRLYHPAYALAENKQLPLWAYTACGFYRNKFYVAACRVDPRRRQSPHFYSAKLIAQKVKHFLKKYPNNRLYRHLAHCALNYNCLAAKNLFLERWEAPLPSARFCNAGCLGCLSLQENNCFSASHRRISFTPKVEEITQVMLNHLTRAKKALVSFGQGCEGEPLLNAKIIAAAIKIVRKITLQGTINMNTNASKPEAVEFLCQAGMDSFRVSLNSPLEKYYHAYFRPRGYDFSDVVKSIRIMKKHKKFVALNLFVFPGFTDSPSQVKALTKFVEVNKIDMIQWRNLNIDPDYYIKHLDFVGPAPLGLLNLLDLFRKKFPKLKMGYFNLAL